MAQSNVGKYEKFFDGYGNPVPETKLDVSIQKRIADEHDAIFADVFGDGVSTDVIGWKVTRADLLAVKVSAGSGFVDGQRVVSASDITILGLPVNSTINIYATAAATPVYNNEIVGWEAMLGWTTSALMAGTIPLAVVVTGATSITSITEGRDIVNTRKGSVDVSQDVVAADDAAGIENRMSMIASRIMDISGTFPEDHSAADPDEPKPWYEQLSDDQRGGPRLAARDRSLYGLNRKFEANLSGATATPSSAPTATPYTSGGSLLDAKYYIVITWADERGDETAPSPEILATVSGGGGNGRITVTAPTALPSTATMLKVYVGSVSGGPYYKAAVVSGTNTLDLLNTTNLDPMQPPVSNTTKNVYSHAHSGDVGSMTGAKIAAADIYFTPTGGISPDNVRHAIRNVNSRKLDKAGGTVGPGALTVTLPTSDSHAVPLGVATAAIAALGPSQFRQNELLFEGEAWEPENPGELPRGIGEPGGDQFTLFKATITTHGGLVILKADTGLTMEGALTHSNQQYAANGSAMTNAGQPLDPDNANWTIPDWKKVVLVVWSFYRNGVLFREHVHAWHSARLDYNAAAYFEFDGFLNVPTYPGSPIKQPRQSYNYVQTLGPVGGLEDSTWGSAFRYCLISPPPKIVDDAVLRAPGTYTYEVRVATLNGATSFRSVRSQGFYGYDGWTVTEQGGGPSLIAEIAPGSGWSYQGLYVSTETKTLTLPINSTGSIYVTGDSSFIYLTSPPLFSYLKLADVVTNGSQITSITQNPVPRGNPGKLKLVELR